MHMKITTAGVKSSRDTDTQVIAATMQFYGIICRTVQDLNTFKCWANMDLPKPGAGDWV